MRPPTLAPFSSAFIAGEPRALGLLEGDYRDPACRRAAALRAAQTAVSPALIAILRAQDRALPPSEARRANLDALATPGTTAVVTGQQVGLFLGPLYTVYKAASAVALARLIEQETGVRTVPVFWLQTEDHDYAEIHHCYLPGRSEGGDGRPRRLSLSDDKAGDDAARSSVIGRVLGEEVRGLLAELRAGLAGLPHAAEVLDLYAAHYRPGEPLWRAFAGVIATLFADEGLIICNPRERAMAELAAPLIAASIDDAEAISALLAERGRVLEAAGFAEQVHVRPNAPLCFFHAPSAEGPRYRLERREGLRASDGRQGAGHAAAWALVGSGGAIDGAALRDALERDPLRFSTSALLRPLLQDTLLPTVAYVGGPGEINYLAQLAPLYRHLGLTQPLLAVRARFRVIDDGARSLLRRLAISEEEAEEDKMTLLRKHAARSPAIGAAASPALLRAGLLEGFSAELARFEPAAAALDPNLVGPLHRTRDTVEKAIARLVDRYERSVLLFDTVTGDRIDRLHALLLPLGEPQERVYGLPYYAARSGLAAFKRAVFAALSPTSTAVGALCP